MLWSLCQTLDNQWSVVCRVHDCGILKIYSKVPDLSHFVPIWSFSDQISQRWSSLQVLVSVCCWCLVSSASTTMWSSPGLCTTCSCRSGQSYPGLTVTTTGTLTAASTWRPSSRRPTWPPTWPWPPMSPPHWRMLCLTLAMLLWQQSAPLSPTRQRQLVKSSGSKWWKEFFFFYSSYLFLLYCWKISVFFFCYAAVRSDVISWPK